MLNANVKALGLGFRVIGLGPSLGFRARAMFRVRVRVRVECNDINRDVHGVWLSIECNYINKGVHRIGVTSREL